MASTLRTLRVVGGLRRSWVHQALRTISTASGPRKVAISGSGIEITSGSGSTPEPKRVTLPSIWLRDNCRCTSCINQDTRQRNFNTFDIPKDITPTELVSSPDGLTVKWSGDGHQSKYTWDFLGFYLRNDHRTDEDVSYRYWGAEIAQEPPTVEYSEVMDESGGEKGVGTLTRLIREYGFAFVANCPHTPEATEKLLERIAFVRVTHYGGFYDFIPDLALADTAYTNLALPAHTDTTYFTDPAGLQSFHLLSHILPPSASASGKGEELGGKSLLVDGIHAANILRKEDPGAFDILSKVRLPWHASGNQGITITPDRRYPVFELEEETGEVHRVRWNNDDRGVVPFDRGVSPTDWYDAARKWHSVLTRPDIEYWTQLRPGQPLIFDNWRVLHGRSAFEGVRRICGGYINRDDFISRWRNTNFPREEVLSQVIG